MGEREKDYGMFGWLLNLKEETKILLLQLLTIAYYTPI